MACLLYKRPVVGTLIAESTHLRSLLLYSVGDEKEAFVLYRISYAWYCMLAVFITILVGSGVSFLVNLFDKDKAKRAMTPEEMNVANLLLNEKEHKSIIAPVWSNPWIDLKIVIDENKSGHIAFEKV